MTREQAINYLICRGITEYRVSEIVRALTYEPTTKNNLPRCQHTDEEIAKSFIEDVEAVKDQLPCFCEQMDFPNTFDEFTNFYGFKDKDEVYTNGSELIPVFRVKQWLEHISTTKNNLGVDCINKADFVKKLESETIGLQSWQKALIYQVMDDCHSVTPQEPQEQQTFKWCTDCKEYDQEKHCCHRWSKVIRDTVEEMKQEQEPILDKIRAEIEQNAYPIVHGVNNHELGMTLYGILQVIDKYKAETEE